MGDPGDGAAGITNDAIAAREMRWRRCPAMCDAPLEELLCRLVIPHGDRRDRTDSRRVEDEHEALGPRDNHVVRVFVLGDDVADDAGRLLNAKPLEHGSERAQATEREAEATQLAWGNLADRFDVDLA